MNYTKQEENGFIVEIWEAECQDCGFLTGLAQITRPDRTRELRSGAGCFTRRNRKVVEAWARQVVRESSTESLDT